ncbi:MAG: DEAD/DEAH box helicase family protein [Bdellovibrionales bacterium]|nr:DEAD/DEAH box helicase family protein [Bdellovibrionales bacterium]
MYKLRRYQQEAVDSTLRHFRRSREPALLVLPTGSGKSLVIAELARIARGRVLVLAHVKELVEQNSQKFESYGLKAGIFSAGLDRKERDEKVIFGGIQSVARADSSFFADFSLVIVDECHRVSGEGGTQYTEVLQKLLSQNPTLCVLGLTATPYRLDTGWIYQTHHHGVVQTTEDRFFRRCLYELTLSEMIQGGYLTPPVQIDAPVASYDFSSLALKNGEHAYRLADIEKILHDQSRVTPSIVQNIVELSKERRGVLIFTSTVQHAREVLSLLPEDQSALVLGETEGSERDELLRNFRERRIKYLVNVSVLTTGFDAPHVDVIAILRPTESVSLYQQIVGRGLRLFEGKSDCLVLDYTGVPHDIFRPEISDKKPFDDATRVRVPCPQCDHNNEFWGVTDSKGEVLEHFGKKCKGASINPESQEILPCGFRYRSTYCDSCNSENDYGAERCVECGATIVSAEMKLKDAASAPDTHVMRPDSMLFDQKRDKKGRERLEVRYYDLDGQFLSEIFFFESDSDAKVFFYNFSRMHNRLPERTLRVRSIEEALLSRDQFRMPIYVIARKQGKYWRIREKIFL